MNQIHPVSTEFLTERESKDLNGFLEVGSNSIELLDKSRDIMRRGAQTIKQSGMDTNGGGVVFSKRERVRKLSGVVGVSSSNENCEMGFVGSDGEDELQPTTSISKRFKVPKKFFDDCNTVDHASVPRRLRSAMKKRNYESISPPLPDKKQPNHVISGGELPKKDSRKKSKSKQQRQSEGSPSQTTEAPITKDEEEAAETLNALAVMFPFPNKKKKNDSGCELENAKSLHLPEAESSRPLFEATEKEDDSKTLCPSTTAKAANPPLLEGSALENVQVKCSKNGSDNNLDDTISQRNVQAMCSKQPKYEELQPTLKERQNSEGLPLWPGLFAAGSHDSRTRVSVRSSIGKTPCSLGMDASLDRHDLLDDGVLTDKDSSDPVARKKSWKRCSAHIYICRLIKDLEIAEINDRSFVPPTQLTPNEGSKQGVFSAANALNMVQNGFHGAVEKNTREVRDAILLHRRLLQDHQQGSTTSSLYNPTQKQCFDFLSLSAGGGGVEVMSSVDKVGKLVEPLTQFHIPYLHSLAQNQSILPFSIPQIRFSSTPFTDNPIAASKQVQIPPPPPPPHLSPPHLCPSASPKLEQQQQQQQWIWTTQYKPMGIATTHFPNWQNGRQDPFGTHYAQSILSPSHSSLEVLGPKYAPISQHQQLIAVTSSLPTAKAKRQHHHHHHHHLPSGYEGNGVGSCPDTALPLQLLCNEHL